MLFVIKLGAGRHAPAHCLRRHGRPPVTSPPSVTDGRSTLLPDRVTRAPQQHVGHARHAGWPGWGSCLPPRVVGPHPGPPRERPPAQESPGAVRFPWETNGVKILLGRTNSDQARLTKANTSDRYPQDSSLTSHNPFSAPDILCHSRPSVGRPLNSDFPPSKRSTGEAMGNEGCHNPADTTCFSHTC